MQEVMREELAGILDGQSQVLHFWNELTDLEKMALAEQVKRIDVKAMNEAFQDAVTRKPFFLDGQSISRVADDRHVVRSNLTEGERDEIFKTGLKAISEGQVAAIVLAGGQASRLGADKPKGVLKLGIDQHSKTDSLFYIQASRIAHLQKLAREEFPNSKGTISWLIMTSKSTYDDTKEHIEQVIAEVGINPDDVILFCQNEIPCFDNDGKFLLKSKGSIFTAPDGNGGILCAIKPLLTILESRGVKYTHVYCVDNILCKVADPYFIGCCIQKNADASAKVIEKTVPNEAVGIVCKDKDGHVCVVEYSEIPKVTFVLLQAV
ncbi:UTP--glucose-1-phosphate uridylyltransferase domain-containing protein [Ditylenchus destructor]|uniref:UDP-N-acetylglucosamine diphosphorylase n=1 Tax=Ditylenchus destructor TaxID=166010 RepID=A0AAD4N335_9BILA|nr:UTP--glucose-1-phosphate uridylyltransferase domain-containing protein [Ditylenchus destructor]